MPQSVDRIAPQTGNAEEAFHNEASHKSIGITASDEVMMGSAAFRTHDAAVLRLQITLGACRTNIVAADFLEKHRSIKGVSLPKREKSAISTGSTKNAVHPQPSAHPEMGKSRISFEKSHWPTMM